jgi:hypothetical protein
MAFVPGFENDIFISYSRSDAREWIQAFEQSLREQLVDILGPEVVIWQDIKEIRLGDDFTAELQEAIRNSAAFIALISPNYLRSAWCRDERVLFLDHCHSRSDLQYGNSCRFLKVVRIRPEDDSHRAILSKIEDLQLYYERAKGDARPLIPGSADFRARMEQAGGAVIALLRRMRSQREAVFVASPAPDGAADWNEITAELRARGYAMRPDAIMDSSFDLDWIRSRVEDVALSVHILGAVYDAFVKDQIDLALESKRRLAFWFTRGAEKTEDKRQRTLLKSISSGSLQANKPSRWDLLRDGSRRSMIGDLIAMLQSKPPATVNRALVAKVYVMCDSSTREDADFALYLKEEIGREEGIEVALDTDLPELPKSEAQQKLLRECDGVLLIRQRAPERWLAETLHQVMFAETLMERPPLRSKALLANCNLVADSPNLRVIPRKPDFSLRDLEPFIAPLRQSRANNA